MLKPLLCVLCLLICCSAATSEPLTKGDVKRGERLFEQNQCSMCHLNGGNMIEPTKPLKGASFAKKYPNDAQIAAIVRKGVAGTGMPSTGKDMLPDKDLCDVIAYIRSFTSIEKPASKPPSTVRAVPPASRTTKKKPAAK